MKTKVYVGLGGVRKLEEHFKEVLVKHHPDHPSTVDDDFPDDADFIDEEVDDE